MRRLVVLTVLALSLAVPAVGFALNQLEEDGTLSVKNGVGRVVLQVNGSTVGRIGHGRVIVTDPIFSGGDGVDFWGCDKQYDLGETTTVCAGSNLRFRAIGGKYKIGIRGSGIFLSAVGRGNVLLDGRGDDPGVERDGAYSFNDEQYRSLPDSPQTYPLVAQSGD
jgi:hypothetical protein